MLPHSVSVSIGAFGGGVYGWICRALRTKSHQIARRNLEIAFPERSPASREAVLRGMWRSWGRFLADAAKLRRLSPARIRELVTLTPPDRPREIQSRAPERGALILTAHFGSFELLHAAVAAYGAPITMVHRTMTNRLVDRWMIELRSSVGTRSLARGEAAKDILRELRDGQIVVLPLDQIAKVVSRVFVPFFGVPAATNTGLARLALASGAPVYPVVLVREGSSLRHRAVFDPEIPIQRTGNREADVLENTRRFNAALEDLIRRHPDHWIWMYGRWKRQPEGRLSPYERDAPPLETYRARTRP
jgi:Kdo2-lipid IVA lauroyltransferase/acyltransferase